MKLLVLLSFLVVGANCDRRQGYGRLRPRPTPTPTTPPLRNGFGPSNDGLIPCSEGQLRNVDGICVDAKVTRNLFVYAARPEPPVPSGPPPQLPPPELQQNLVFIRTADSPPAPEPIIVPPPRQQNLVYVLKKRQQQQQRVINVPAQPAAKPEVYFVHFDDDHNNPQLPGGIDLQTALDTAAQGGGSVEDFLEGRDDSIPRHRPSLLFKSPILNGLDPTNTASTPNLNGRPLYPGQYTVPRTFPHDSREDTIPVPVNTSPQSTSQAIPPPPPGYSLPQFNPTQTNRPQSTSPPQYLTPWVTSPQGGSRYGPGGATGSSEVIRGTVGPSNRYTGPNQGPVLGGVDRYGGNRYGDDSDEQGISRISVGEGGFIGILGDSGIVGDNNGRYGLNGVSGEITYVSSGNNGRYGFNGRTTNGVRGGPDRNGVTTGNINRYIGSGENGGLAGYRNNGNGFPHGFDGDAFDEIVGVSQGYPEHRGRLVGGDAVAGNSYIPSAFVGDNSGEDNSFIRGNGNTNYRENRNGGFVIDDSTEDSIFYGNEPVPSVDETGVTSNRNGVHLDEQSERSLF